MKKQNLIKIIAIAALTGLVVALGAIGVVKLGGIIIDARNTQTKTEAEDNNYTIHTIVSFQSSHDSTSISVNPAVGFAGDKTVIGSTTSQSTQTVGDYYIVGTNGGNYYLLRISQYKDWLLASSLETFVITKRQVLGITGYEYKSSDVRIQALTEEEAQAYIKACTPAEE